MVFKILLEPSEDGGYTATVPALPGCISEGETIDQAMDNIREAIELYLEPIEGPQATAGGALVKELTL
jgi:predicted RNase H-like HicB family nuclease